jgi:large repetitive protein
MNLRSMFGGRAAVAVTAVLASVLAWPMVQPAQALSIRPFGIRYQADINGAIDIFANTLMTCPASAACTKVQNGTVNDNNNSFAMVAIDADGSTFTTTNSSMTTVSFPAGAIVRSAGLYWGASSSATTRNQISFRRPGDATYSTVTASQVDATGSVYQAYADVTARVLAAGIGQYWAGNVALTAGSGQHAGWSLVVVWEHPSQPLRNLTVFDGFGQVSTASAADSVLNIPISGFLTPPAGPVKSRSWCRLL